LSYERLCAEIIVQTALLRSTIEGADLTVTVPSCPDWNLGQLLRHVGGAHASAEEIVRKRADPAPVDDEWRDLSAYTHEDPAVLGPWLTAGAERLVDSLRAAGPAAEVATPVPNQATIFFARRMTHETVMHRADASLAAGVAFRLAQDVAVDAQDEWIQLGSLPVMLEFYPERRELLAPGRTLLFHATDTPAGTNANWLVDLTGDTLAWRRSYEEAAVVVSGSVTDLLLVIYGRRSARDAAVDIRGDADLLDCWLQRVSFG
jgi:uncharacterized protein (TIGR03083 family)